MMRSAGECGTYKLRGQLALLGELNEIEPKEARVEYCGAASF